MNKVTIYSLLALVVAIGLYLRVGIGLNWDEDQHLHPDERFLTMVTSDTQLPNSISQYFDSANSPLNPYNKNYHFFVYGTFPIFLTKFIAVAIGQDGYGSVHLVGRVLSSVFDILTALLLFLVGRRLYSVEVGLLAAALFVCLVLNIQMSHFYGVEIQAAFFVLLSFYFSIPLLEAREQLPKFRWFLLTGISFGLALTSKISSIFFAPIIALCGAIGAWRYLMRKGFSFGGLTKVFLRQATYALGLLALCALMFRVFQPYAFAGTSFWNWTFAERFLANMQEIKGLMNGADYPPSIQWVNRPVFLFSFYNMVIWHFGAVLGICAWLGVVWVLVELLRFRESKHLPALIWVLFWFGYQSTQFVKAGRYLMAAYPFFTLIAAYFLVRMGDLLVERLKSSLKATELRYVRILPATVVLIFTICWALAFTSIYRKPVTRVAASNWMYDNIPCGSVIGNEHWDDGMPMRTNGRDGFGGCYKGLEFNHYWPDDRKKLQDTLAKLEQVDYLVLSSNRLYESIPRLPRRFPFTIEYYKLLFSGALGFEQIGVFSSYPSLFGKEFNDDRAEEPFTVYDHPKVYIFKKTSAFNIFRIRERLSAYPDGVIEPLI